MFSIKKNIAKGLTYTILRIDVKHRERGRTLFITAKLYSILAQETSSYFPIPRKCTFVPNRKKERENTGRGTLFTYRIDHTCRESFFHGHICQKGLPPQSRRQNKSKLANWRWICFFRRFFALSYFQSFGFAILPFFFFERSTSRKEGQHQDQVDEGRSI